MSYSLGKWSFTGLLAAAISLVFLVVAAPAQATWTPPATITSESNPSDGALVINRNELRQAVLEDGSSVAAWRELNGGNFLIRARTQGRDGSTLGSTTTIVNIPTTISNASWDVAAAGNGFVFFWVESWSLAGNQGMDLKYRTMSASATLGPIQSLDSVLVQSAEGEVALQAISTSPGRGFANVAWGSVDRRGPAASNCNPPPFGLPTGTCTLTQKARFARISEDGTQVLEPADLLSRSYTSENTSCYFDDFGDSTESRIESLPSSGAATVLIEDYCRPAGGESTWTSLFSRVSANGDISEPEFLSLAGSTNSSISSDGTVVVSAFDRLYRISPKGAVSGPILNITEVGREWGSSSASVIALPQNRQIVVWSSSRISGANKISNVWSRVVEADGSLGKPKVLWSRTLTSTEPGTPRWFFFVSQLVAGGLGKDTGTVLITAQDELRTSSTSRSRTYEGFALAVNSKGAKVAGSEVELFSRSVTFDPTTEVGFLSLEVALDVASDGTASALALPSVTKYVDSAPFPGSAEISLVGTKLARNANTCGVTPSLCKANVRVKGLKVTGRGNKKKLTITLRNTGNRDASKVKVRLSAKGGARAPKTVAFPNVLEGKTAKKTVTVRGSGSIKVKVGKSSKTVRI